MYAGESKKYIYFTIDFVSTRFCATLLEINPLNIEREQHSIPIGCF